MPRVREGSGAQQRQGSEREKLGSPAAAEESPP